MKSSEFITELFDPCGAYPYSFSDEEGYVEAKAETKDGRPIIVEFTQEEISTQVVFSVDHSIKVTKVTKGGDAPRIMTTVLAIINDYIKSHHPDILYFSSFDPSRSKLYNAICHRFAKDSGFVAETHQITKSKTEFVLKNEN